VRIRAAVSTYVEDLRARHASTSLVVQAERSLGRFASHLRERGVRQLRDVREAHLVSFARTLRESTTPRGTLLSATSQGHYLQRVKSCFGALTRQGLILQDPAAELVLPSSAPLPRTLLSVNDARRLMEAPPDTRTGKRDRAILETLYGTGIRRGECARLDLQDLDLRARTLLVRNGKGGKDRMIPVTGRAAVALGVYLRDVRPELVVGPSEGALFLTAWWGQRLSDISIVFLLRRYAHAAGLPHVHPHALRHACATHLLKGGADVRHVQALLGHRKLQTTALYTRVVIEDLRKVLARAHPREERTRKTALKTGTRMGVWRA
jgi:integrase/recombinase XerD